MTSMNERWCLAAPVHILNDNVIVEEDVNMEGGYDAAAPLIENDRRRDVTNIDTCNGWCGTNNDCNPYGECSRCQEDIDTCVKGRSCGSSCNVTTDCNQHSNCSQCVQGLCTTGCGQPCNSTSQCVTFGCNECYFGQCVLWQCNRYCTSDAPCVMGGYPGCGTCDNNGPNTPGMCRSTCGAACNGGYDCPARCPFCVGGICTVT